MTENSDKTYERGATLHSACECCEHAAEEIERLTKVVADLLSLGQIPAEDVARHFVEGELGNPFSIARTGHEELGKSQTTDRLAEVIRRARLDGANAAARLNEADWEAFCRALDEPPAPNEELKKFLAKESPWEQPLDGTAKLT